MKQNIACPSCGNNIGFELILDAKPSKLARPPLDEIARILDAEALNAVMNRAKYRGNQTLANKFGISIKTAELWAMEAKDFRKYHSPQSTKRKRRQKVLVNA